MSLAMTRRRLFLAYLFCLVCAIAYNSGNLSAQTEIQWLSWKPHIFNQAQQKNRLVLLDLTAKWCQFCRKMDKVTYTDKAVTDIIKQNYLAVRADEADYPELVKRYQNHGLPLTVIFDSQGNEVIKRSGYMEPQWMVWMLSAVVQDPERNSQKDRSY